MQTLTNVTDTQKEPYKRTDIEPAFKMIVPDYALVFFDHLYSEYLTLKHEIRNKELIDLLESIYEHRQKFELTWSDIYTFDLALVDARSLENLLRKAYDARTKYRSIAGQKEYAEYLASKPPSLIEPNHKAGLAESTIPITLTPEFLPSSDNTQPETEQMSRPSEAITRVVRADVRYLLSKFYLYYAMLPMRERMREHLTRKTVTMAIMILTALTVMMIVAIGAGRLAGDTFIIVSFSITAYSVAVAGIIGGCVSMLQRIQNAPVEGDVWFNLVALTNSWGGLSLSPVYGAVFAWLLFVLFAAGILQGPAFPKMGTAGNISAPQTTQTGDTSGTAVSPNANTAQTPLDSDTQPTRIMHIKDFLRQTGPRDGVSFALLLLWSFIAGFAERLVPDIINRFIAKHEAIQGT